MFVEILRLFVVVAFTAAGYAIGRRISPQVGQELNIAESLGLALGCAFGYVLGGVLGRFVERAFGLVEKKVEDAQPGSLFSGTLGAVVGGAVGTLVTLPTFFFLDWYFAYPIVAFLAFVLGTLGWRIASHKSEELLGLAGLSTRPLVRATRFSASSDDAYLLDTSALIDGRLLEVVKAGFVRGNLLVAPFILDELQGIADAGESGLRRRGRRGLEVLGVLRELPSIEVLVLDDEVPEMEKVDAKLVALANRLRVGIVTTDGNLQKIAEVQGIRVLNLNRLATALRPDNLPGDRIRVQITKTGEQPRQGVGYLDDGTMVVVEGAADKIGEELGAVVTSMTQSSVGRMLFATVSSGDGEGGGRESAAGDRIDSGGDPNGRTDGDDAPVAEASDAASPDRPTAHARSESK